MWHRLSVYLGILKKIDSFSATKLSRILIILSEAMQLKAIFQSWLHGLDQILLTFMIETEMIWLRSTAVLLYDKSLWFKVIPKCISVLNSVILDGRNNWIHIDKFRTGISSLVQNQIW